MKRSIEKKLIEMYNSVPNLPNPLYKESIIKEAKNIELFIPKESSLFWFLKRQIRFIDAKLWIFEIILLFSYMFYIYFNIPYKKEFLVLVPITPIIVLISTTQLSCSYRYNMVEMEIPNYFSLRKVMLARIIIIATIDIITLTCLIIITSLKVYTAINLLILYGIVPCLVTAYGCLYIINKFNTEYSIYYTTAYSITLSIIGGISINTYPMLYDISAQGIWILVFCIAFFGIFSEVYKMIRNCNNKLEYFNYN